MMHSGIPVPPCCAHATFRLVGKHVNHKNLSIMKTTKKNFNSWDAFVGFMEDIYWEGVVEESTPEFVAFHWEEFQKMM